MHSSSFIGCVSPRELNTSCVYWYITAYTIWRRNTWPTAFNACPMSRLGDISFGDNIATDRTCHPLFNARRPSVPCRRCSRLECSTAFSVICFVTSYFQTTFKDIFSNAVFSPSFYLFLTFVQCP